MLDLYKTLKPRDIIIKEKLEETWSKLESDYLTNPLETIKHLVLNDCQIVDNDEAIFVHFGAVKFLCDFETGPLKVIFQFARPIDTFFENDFEEFGKLKEKSIVKGHLYDHMEFIAMPELLQCLAELKIDKAKKIEQEIFTNIDNAINWYYKFYPAKTDDEKESLLTVEFKRNKTKKAIQELIKRIEKTTTIEEARIILEDFNFTPPENKSKKSYIT